MLDEIKNVIIAFGLIAIVFMQGSFTYQKKIQKEQTAILIQQEFQKLKNEDLIKSKQNILNQKEIIADEVIPVQTTTVTSNNNSTTSQSDLALVKEKAALLLEQKTLIKQQAARVLAQQQAAKALAEAKVTAIAQATVTSRQSRAS